MVDSLDNIVCDDQGKQKRAGVVSRRQRAQGKNSEKKKKKMKRNKNHNLPGNLEGCIVFWVSNMRQKRLSTITFSLR